MTRHAQTNEVVDVTPIQAVYVRPLEPSFGFSTLDAHGGYTFCASEPVVKPSVSDRIPLPGIMAVSNWHLLVLERSVAGLEPIRAANFSKMRGIRLSVRCPGARSRAEVPNRPVVPGWDSLV